MLNTKGQKLQMFLIGFVSLLLGAVIIIPFNSVTVYSKIYPIELICKICIIPILMLLISVTPNKFKYHQVKGYRNQSRVVSFMSYFPMFIYLVAIAVESFYLLGQGYIINGGVPYGLELWSLLFLGLIVFVVALILCYHFMPRFEMRFNVKQHIIFDLIIFIVVLCFIGIYAYCLSHTHDLFVSAKPTGNPMLLYIYIASLIFIIFELSFISKTLADDEVNVNIDFKDLDCTEYVSQMAEYNRAYNDIMDEFEEFFDNEEELEFDDEEQAETEEQPQVEKEEQSGAVAMQEAIDQETVQEIEKLEVEVEELKQAQVEKEEKAAERARQRELAKNAALEKALKNKEEMRPTFAELVAYAKSLDQVSSIEDKEKNQVKFYIGKKNFLVITDSEKDYRLQFNVDPVKIIEWWALNPEIRPRSNKSDNWYKLVNKGSFTKELLFDIVLNSRDFMVAQIAEAEAQKAAKREEARLARAEARKNASK